MNQSEELKRLNELVEAKAAENSKERLYTSKEIAAKGILGVTHHKTVEQYALERGLPCVHVGRNVRFRLGDVLAWVKAQRG